MPTEPLTMPDHLAVLGKCERCGAQMTMAEEWYRFLRRLLNAVNGVI